MIHILRNKNKNKNMNIKDVTLETLKADVIASGFTLLTAWEDEFMMFACSVESVPGCLGHPRHESTFSKTTHWLSLGKKPSIKCV